MHDMQISFLVIYESTFVRLDMSIIIFPRHLLENRLQLFSKGSVLEVHKYTKNDCNIILLCVAKQPAFSLNIINGFRLSFLEVKQLLEGGIWKRMFNENNCLTV